MAGRRLLYLASLLACLVFLIFYQEWFSWFALMALLWLPVLSLVLSLPGALSARGQVNCPDNLARNAPGTAVLEAVSRFPAPPFRGKLRLTHSMTGKSFVQKFGAPLPTGYCGQWTLDIVRPRIYDYLGLFRLPLRRQGPKKVLVWPQSTPMEQVPDFSRPPARLWKPKPGGGFSENHELRLYRPGDSLQQIHWKLSSKTGKLIFRESMEPVHRKIQLSLNLTGSPEVLNRKLGQLLWLGSQLLRRGMYFEIAALTGLGTLTWQVGSEDSFRMAMRELMSSPAAAAGSVSDATSGAFQRYHIGGDSDEA